MQQDRWLLFGTFSYLLAMLALPFGVHMTALGLEEEVNGTRFAIGLPLIGLGILAVECFRRSVAALRIDAEQKAAAATSEGRDPEGAGRFLHDLPFLRVVAAAWLQLLTVNMFFCMLDGHVRLRACCWLYLVYADGAVLVLALQRGRPRGWGSRYLWWGWVPIIAFGVPLFLPALREAGLVPFSPLHF
jgi:hypothetical protein